MTVNSVFSPLAQLTLPILEKIGNAVIAQDSVTQMKLSELDGKVISIEMTRPSHQAFIRIIDNAIYLQQIFEGSPDLILRAPLSTFIKLVSTHNPAVTILSEDI